MHGNQTDVMRQKTREQLVNPEFQSLGLDRAGRNDFGKAHLREDSRNIMVIEPIERYGVDLSSSEVGPQLGLEKVNQRFEFLNTVDGGEEHGTFVFLEELGQTAQVAEANFERVIGLPQLGKVGDHGVIGRIERKESGDRMMLGR
ncbi:MAG: hypothetical protein A2X94_14250 [Bdellovibrionales bacterium GWB1_55_8]|nr:MAG: hypothetical protein A2X94_14250 [Bdellovibrionales bacterium GWB1_55_8]